MISMSEAFSFDAAWNNDWQFRAAFDTMQIHNHLNGAYHRANLYSLAPHRSLMWRIPVAAVPRSVRRLIDADAIVADMKQRLASARQLLNDNRELLDHAGSTIINQIDGRTGKTYHYEGRFPGITVAAEGRPTYQIAWKYSFNPYEVGHAMITEFLRYIDKVMASNKSDFTKLSRIHEKAKSYDDSARLVGGMFR